MKKVFMALTLAATMLCFSGCGEPIENPETDFDKGMIKLSDGKVISGDVDDIEGLENAKDELVWVKINGKTYVTHISNITLIVE